MPQLASGRRVAVAPIPLLDRIKFGTDDRVYAFIVAYRLEVRRPSDLRPLLPVVYFKEGQPMAPGAPTEDSGHTVRSVLAGDAGWSDEEIREFKNWLEVDVALNAWLRRHMRRSRVQFEAARSGRQSL